MALSTINISFDRVKREVDDLRNPISGGKGRTNLSSAIFILFRYADYSATYVIFGQPFDIYSNLRQEALKAYLLK